MKKKNIKNLLVLLMFVIFVSCVPSSISEKTNLGTSKIKDATIQIFDVEEMNVRCVFVDGFYSGAMWCIDLK